MIVLPDRLKTLYSRCLREGGRENPALPACAAGGLLASATNRDLLLLDQSEWRNQIEISRFLALAGWRKERAAVPKQFLESTKHHRCCFVS